MYVCTVIVIIPPYSMYVRSVSINLHKIIIIKTLSQSSAIKRTIHNITLGLTIFVFFYNIY